MSTIMNSIMSSNASINHIRYQQSAMIIIDQAAVWSLLHTGHKCICSVAFTGRAGDSAEL